MLSILRPLFLLIMTLMPVCLQAQSLQQFDSRPFNAGARAASLGEAYTAETEDASALYWNPASLAFIPAPAIVAAFAMDWDRQSSSNSAGMPFQIADNQRVVIGLSSTLFGHPWLHPNFVDGGIDLGYANRIAPTLSVGLLTKIRDGGTVGSSLWTASAAIGVLYYPSPGISYGLAFRDIGSDVIYSYDNTHGYLSYEKNLPRSMTIGSAFHFPSTSDHPYVNISMDSELLFGPSRFRNKGGIEIQPWSYLALRIGGLTSDSGNVLRMGIGFQFGSFQIDYVVSPGPKTAQFHEISFALPLRRSQD